MANLNPQFPDKNPGFIVWLDDNPDGFFMFADRWNVRGRRVFFWDGTTDEPYWDTRTDGVLWIQRYR